MLQQLYCQWYQAKILLSLSKDPKLSVVRDLCIQADACGSQTSIYIWKWNCQMAFFGLLTHRLKFLETKHKILALLNFSQTSSNLSPKSQKQKVVVSLFFLESY